MENSSVPNVELATERENRQMYEFINSTDFELICVCNQKCAIWRK